MGDLIETLVRPAPIKASSGRKVWGIDLETVWLPFYTATNAEGKTLLPNEALGAPLRLQYEKDSTVKFSKNGKPVIRVAPELSAAVKLARDNFAAQLVDHARRVATESKEKYIAQVKANHEAGKPIIERDKLALESVYTTLMDMMVKAKAGEATPEAPTEAPAATEAPTGELVGVAS